MDLFEKYLTSAYRFLARRPRSEKEVRDNLIKKRATPEIIEVIIESLKKQRFLNDTEFARWWIRQRRTFSQRGKHLLRLELIQKGINKDIIETVLSESVEEEASDLEQARQLLSKKIKKYQGVEKEEIYRKLGGFLARKGFSWDTIKRVIDESLKISYNRE